MIEVKEYFPLEHYQTIENWAAKRKFIFPESDRLPPTGLVGYINDTPVAACFLSKTDSGSAMLMGLITDPDYENGAERKEVGDILMQKLLLMADDEDLEIFCWTSVKSMESRLEDIGFAETEKVKFYIM